MISRAGGFLAVINDRGCRHLIRATAIQVLSDADEFHDSTLVVVAGRTITVPEPLDGIVDCLEFRGGR